jgi:hypothetical protein
MSNVVKQEMLQHVASYGDGFDDDPGFEVSSGGSLFAGKTRLSFDGAKVDKWFASTSKAPMLKGLELIVDDRRRIVVQWGKEPLSGPVAQRQLAQGEKFPDFTALNNSVPKSEWRVGLNGAPAGPWEGQNVLEFIDEKTLDHYAWPSKVDTVGATICVREIVEKVQWMRRFRGELVKPVVELSDCFMPTQYGGRQRPHLIVKYWVRFSGGSRLALPASDNSALTAGGNKPAQQPVNDNSMQTVEEPSLREVTKDEIPY